MSRKTLIINYSDDVNYSIGRPIIVKIGTLDIVEKGYSRYSRDNEVLAMFIDMPFTSISNIDYKKEWENIPLVLKAYNIGDYNILLDKINTIKSLDIRFYFSNSSPSICTDLKFLASLGIDCGMFMEDDIKMDDDKFLDLASYYYMSPVPHATIEPFDYILKHLNDESTDNFDNVYVNVESSTRGDDEFDSKYNDFYIHFMDLNACSVCPAFKICNKKMQNKLNNCKEVMSEIYEYAEIKDELNANTYKTKKICQL